MSDETLVTPSVLRASAIACPMSFALSAEPFSITSPFLASTSMLALEASLSACSLPLTMVLITSSSVEPVGAPTTESLVRTMVTPRSRSAWISDAPSRHSVIRLARSALVLAALLVSVEAVAPVVLVELLVAPIVLVLLVSGLIGLGYVVSVGLGVVLVTLVSVEGLREVVSEELEVEVLGVDVRSEERRVGTGRDAK